MCFWMLKDPLWGDLCAACVWVVYLWVAHAPQAVLSVSFWAPAANLLGHRLSTSGDPRLALGDPALHWSVTFTPKHTRLPALIYTNRNDPECADGAKLTGCWRHLWSQVEAERCSVPDHRHGREWEAPRAETVMAFDSVWDIQHGHRQLSGRLTGWREKEQSSNKKEQSQANTVMEKQ